jgi:hypothetical protein
MDLALYRGASGVYIAVPDCMRPSIEAEHLHGPLEFHGKYAVAEATAMGITHFSPDIDAQSYAVLSRDEAARLLASGKQQPDCAWVHGASAS